MPSRADIVKIARGHVGTRYAHLGRAPGVALDCIGLLVVTLREAGLTHVANHDVLGYHRRPTGNELVTVLSKALLPGDEPRIASVGAFWITDPSRPTHVAIFAKHPAIDALSIIHSYVPARKVAENVYDAYWQYRLAHLFEIPGLD